MGMPLYGRAFASTKGPGQPFSGTGEGSWEQGVWDYKVLPQQGAQQFIDHQSGASWSYDANKQLMVSYDSPEMAKVKTDFIKSQGLGGSMWWESSGDVSSLSRLIYLNLNYRDHWAVLFHSWDWSLFQEADFLKIQRQGNDSLIRKVYLDDQVKC